MKSMTIHPTVDVPYTTYIGEIKHPMNREIYSNVRPVSPRNYSTRPEHIYVNKENMHFPHNMDMNNSDSYRFKRDMREVYEDRRGINGSYTQYP